MAEPLVQFPEAVDVILPILDGWTPITPQDLNVYGAVMRRIEEVLGAGNNGPIGGSLLYGPKAGATSLADRLDSFLDLDGTMQDIAFVTGSTPLSAFTGNGLFVPFGKTLSRGGEGADSYITMFDCKSPGTEDESGTERWDPEVPSCWWTNQKSTTGVTIAARGMRNEAFGTTQSTVQYCLLAIAYEAFATG